MPDFYDWSTPLFFPGIGLINASGSFRGAPFRLDSYETTTGRRLDVHEYPLRNRPNAEDLGRRARRFVFTGYVLGPGWELQRDALLNACEQDGPGLLVHPFHGEQVVMCETCTVSESRSGGRRYAAFQLTFVEKGTYETPSYSIDPGYALLGQVSGGYGVMEGAFSG
jgi:prophage DNA circulation protein